MSDTEDVLNRIDETLERMNGDSEQLNEGMSVGHGLQTGDIGTFFELLFENENKNTVVGRFMMFLADNNPTADEIHEWVDNNYNRDEADALAGFFRLYSEEVTGFELLYEIVQQHV